jgi:O-succinylbenzoic acid--CoA ligase
MKVYSSPLGELVNLEPAAREKAGRLAAAAEEGKKFLVLAATGDPECLEWILASFYSPLTVVPIFPALPELEKVRLLAQLPRNQCVDLTHLTDSTSPSREKSPEEIWAVIFSSGSSGEPKGVALSGRALRESAAAHMEHSGRHNWLLNLPLHHVGGFSVVSRSFFSGTSIALAGARFSTEETMGWFRSGRVEGVSLVPTTLSRLLKAKADFSFLRLVLLGGAPAGPEYEEAVALGWPVRATYGLTENSSQVTTEKLAGGGMWPLPRVELKIEDGEIFLRSPCLAAGYFRQGKLEPLPTERGFFPTGDLGRLEGGALVVEGRRSEMIITGGVKVFPAEIESALQGLLGLHDAAITSLPDAEWGEIVCLAIVSESVSHETVKSYLAARIDPRKMPKVWVNLAAIPRSALGKVQRAILREEIARLRG